MKVSSIEVHIWDGPPKLLGCARSGTLDISTSLIETSTVGNGRDTTWKGEKNSYVGTIEGLINLEPGSMIRIDRLIQIQVAQTPANMYYNISDGTNTFTFSMYFFITNISIADSFDGVASFNLSIQGTGTPTITSITPS